MLISTPPLSSQDTCTSHRAREKTDSYTNGVVGAGILGSRNRTPDQASWVLNTGDSTWKPGRRGPQIRNPPREMDTGGRSGKLPVAYRCPLMALLTKTIFHPNSPVVVSASFKSPPTGWLPSSTFDRQYPLTTSTCVCAHGHADTHTHTPTHTHRASRHSTDASCRWRRLLLQSTGCLTIPIASTQIHLRPFSPVVTCSLKNSAAKPG